MSTKSNTTPKPHKPTLPPTRRTLSKRPCCCGCGQLTGREFAQGHDARLKGWLLRLERGEVGLAEVLTEAQAKALGPWTKSTDDEGREGVLPKLGSASEVKPVAFAPALRKALS